jgi:hypothetical protein
VSLPLVVTVSVVRSGWTGQESAEAVVPAGIMLVAGKG